MKESSSVDSVENEKPVEPRRKRRKKRKKAKKVPWITVEIAKDLDRDIYLAARCREGYFFAFFLICTSIVAVGMIDPTTYFMAQALRTHMVDHAGKPYPEAADTSKTKFDDITTVDEMWDYLEVHLLPIMYPNAFDQSKEKDKGIGKENVMVGIPVVRQVMVQKKDCPDPFPRAFRDCYPMYSRKTLLDRDRDEIPVKYQKEKDTEAAVWCGRVARYYGDGFQQELSRTLEESKKILEHLKKSKFVQKGTRAIFVDAAYYNPYVNRFTAVKIAFELPPTGAVIPTANIIGLKLFRYIDVFDHFVLACEIIFLIMVVYYFIEEIREILYMKLDYFCRFWNYVDVAVIVSAIALIAIRIQLHVQSKDLLANIEKAVDKYNSMQYIVNVDMSYKNALAVVVFLVYFKLFKYMIHTRWMAELYRALEKSALDIAAFVFKFIIVFIGFGLYGCLSFGTQLWDFSTFGLSLFALLRILLGDFSYSSLHKADSVIAPFFYLAYLIVVYFIMLNLFLAIIFDCYMDAKLEYAILPEQRHMTDFYDGVLYNITRCCGCRSCCPDYLFAKPNKYNTIEDIKATLKKCGFTDLDIEMFLARYNIDPDARVRTRDPNKLMENLRSEIPPKPDESAPIPQTPAIPAYAVESGKPGVESRREPTSTHAPTVTVKDFAAQQQRLNKVESVMASIGEKLDILLMRLNNLDTRTLSMK